MPTLGPIQPITTDLFQSLDEELSVILNKNHYLSLSHRNDKLQYMGRGLYDTFNLLIGISITLLFIYKLRKIN